MNKEITTLEGEMVLRNAQISELQQKIVDADQGLLHLIFDLLNHLLHKDLMKPLPSHVSL